MKQMVIKPRDCIIALTIPMNKSEFEHDLNECADKDFVKSHCRDFRGNIKDEMLWEASGYAKMICKLYELIDEIELLGATVISRLVFKDFDSLFNNNKVITLLAHWRSSIFFPEDFIHPSAIAFKLINSQNISVKYIREHLSSELQGYIKSIAPDEMLPKDIIKKMTDNFNQILNGEWILTDEVFKRLKCDNIPKNVIDQLMPLKGNYFSDEGLFIDALKCKLQKYNDAYYSIILKHAYQCLFYIEYPNNRNHPIMEYPLYRYYLNRQIFDRLFFGQIKQGSCVEFFDKLYPVNDIVEHVPKDFHRTIELTVCNSIVLGEEIKRHRRNCLVIGNKEPADPVFRLTCYRYLLEMLNQKEMSYIEGYATLRKMLATSIGR